jgi:putrescine transport system permease protein
MPVVASVVIARLAGIDPDYEEAALDLGARPLRVLLTVTMPLLAPALASGWLLAFTLSFDDVITSSFVAGPEYATLPMFVYSSARVGVSPVLNVVGTLIIGGVAVLVTCAMLFSRGESSAAIGLRADGPGRDAPGGNTG